MRSHRLLLLAGILGASGVALGAFGAHALKARLAEAGMTAVWDKAVLYHLIHSVAVLVAGLLPANPSPTPNRWLARAGITWAWGVVFFSGSLYGLALGGPKLLGPITPIGGVLFITGWVFVILAGTGEKRA